MLSYVQQQQTSFSGSQNVVVQAILDAWEAAAGRYQVIPALTREQNLLAYRLRAAVFCHEKGYEPLAELERDSHDERALQLLLWDHGNNRAIGCARLVPGRLGQNMYRLPMQEICPVLSSTETFQRISASGQNYAEISRVLLLPGSRALDGQGARSVTPLLSLLMGIQAYAEIRGIPRQTALVERSFSRLLTGLGVDVQTMGPPVVYRGIRYPIGLETQQILEAMTGKNRGVYESIRQRMANDLNVSERSGYKIIRLVSTTAREQSAERLEL